MKYLLLTTIVLFFTNFDVSSQERKKLSLGISTEIGFDMQTRSNDYNLYGPLAIPTSLGNSILNIEKPYRHQLNFFLEKNDFLQYSLSVGRTSRALRYWSIDSTITDQSYRNDKIDLRVSQIDLLLGFKFNSSIDGKLNFYLHQSFGASFGQGSPRFSITKDHKRAELIYLHSQTEAVLVSVSMPDPIISIDTEIGCEYSMTKKLYLTFSLGINNQVSNGNSLIVWAYNLETDAISGGYSPYDMEFKTIFSELGLNYRFFK